MNDIVNAISNLGFPIFCVIALGALVYKGFDKITTANEQRESRLYATIESVRDQLTKASEVNASFVEILNDFRSDISNIQEDIDDIKITIGNYKKE